MPKSKYQYREWNGNQIDIFNQVESSCAHQLYDGVQVNSFCIDMSQVKVIRLILCGHEQNQHALDKLDY